LELSCRQLARHRYFSAVAASAGGNPRPFRSDILDDLVAAPIAGRRPNRLFGVGSKAEFDGRVAQIRVQIEETTYGDLYAQGVIDPAKVERTAL
jgi:chaperonin GroEL (HSP60 family)